MWPLSGFPSRTGRHLASVAFQSGGSISHRLFIVDETPSEAACPPSGHSPSIPYRPPVLPTHLHASAGTFLVPFAYVDRDGL